MIVPLWNLIIPFSAARPGPSRGTQLTAQQKKALEFEKLNARLQPLAMSDSDDDVPVMTTKSKKSEDKKGSKSLRKRNVSSSEDEVVIPKKNQKPSKFEESEESDDEKDARERDEFASRIKDYDKNKTRKIVSKSEAKANAEAAQRLKVADSTDQRSLIKEARYESRKSYLGKRKEDKIYELKRMLQEEEELIPEEE